MTVELLLDSHPLVKLPLLTAFSKTNIPTKIEGLCTRQVSILFKNMWRFFFVLYQGTLGCFLMYLKLHQSGRQHIYQPVYINVPAI